MDSTEWHREPLDWASHSFRLLAPRVSVKGRMALVLFLAVGWAVSWLLWRAYSVVQTPNEILVDKLGLDIPPSPNVTLEYISSREVQISWKHSDPQNSVLSHVIEVNGKIVGETKRNETATSILNLTPGTIYDIRVFTISATNFQTPSPLLRIRTSPSSDPPSQDGIADDAITIRAYSAKVSVPHSPVPAPAMERERSGGHPFARRGTTGRRASPATLQPEIGAAQLDDSHSATDDEVEGNLAQLSERFQRIQQDIDTTEGQIVEDEEEFDAALKDLEQKRDELKLQLKERDDASNELRKQVHKAEAVSRAAQSEKSKKERLLHQREGQRKKHKEEIARWDDQISSMTEEMAGIETQKAAIEKRTQSEIREIRRKIEEEQKEVRSLDEENKEKALQIKALEEERKQMNVDDETDESREADRQEYERDMDWHARLAQLTNIYRGLYAALQQAQQQYDIARERLAWCESARRATAASFAPGLAPIDMDAVRRGMKPRKPRHTLSMASSVSSPRAAVSYDTYASSAAYSNAINASPTLAGPSFFNAKNGMTLVAPPESPELKPEEFDLTGGAPMSPRADALLPADLLGDESADDIAEDEDEIPTMTASGETRATFPRLEPPILRETENVPGSPSPLSSSSKSFSSPHESFAHMAGSDQASIQSGRESFQHEQENEGDPSQTNTRKLMSNLFSFNRQRGKTLAEESPMLGTLKTAQSQSFPRKFGEELDPLTKQRRRLSYGGNWAFPGNLLPRASTDKEASATRRALPNIFSSIGRSTAATASYDPFAARSKSNDPSIRIDSSAPRPSSVYSFDKMPRPSLESQFHAWGPEKSGLRGSPLGPDWASTHSGWSRNPSRRPSIHYGSTSNLSLALPADADFLESDEPQRNLQAPIGTRPPSSQTRPLTPKLNPAAPSFTTLFNKRAEKNKTKSKDANKDRDRSIEVPDNASPPDSRKSRETPSLAPTESTRGSLERTTSAHSGGTGTPAEGTTPAKSTLISRMTRKASSNKFGSWKEKGGLFSSSRKDTSTGLVTPTQTGEVDDDLGASGSFEQLGKSLESTSTTPSADKEEKDKKASRPSLTWSFIRSRKDRKGKEDLTASEVSESSERASEVGEEIEEDE